MYWRGSSQTMSSLEVVCWSVRDLLICFTISVCATGVHAGRLLWPSDRELQHRPARVPDVLRGAQPRSQGHCLVTAVLRSSAQIPAKRETQGQAFQRLPEQGSRLPQVLHSAASGLAQVFLLQEEQCHRTRANFGLEDEQPTSSLVMFCTVLSCHGAERFVFEVDLILIRGETASFQRNSFSKPACAHDWSLQCSQVL